MPVSPQTLHAAQRPSRLTHTLAIRLARMLTHMLAITLTAALASVLSGCSWPAATAAATTAALPSTGSQTITPLTTQATELQARLDAWLPADVLLLGEQHDAPAHQALEGQIVAALASRGQLAALTLEMADSDSSTASLSPKSTEAQVRSALVWDNDAWPWAAYGPAVMAAVRAGVPVLGANLARVHFRASMADAQLDQRLPGPALKAQQQLIRQGHCGLLPESQITPMTRIQIARDRRMAETLQRALLPGRVVVLLAGSVHADRQLGVPQHLPPGLRVKSIRLQAGPSSSPGESFDSVWATEAAPETDHCEGLRRRLGKN